MIYCVEDDRAIRELMVYTLKASQFEAEGFANAQEFWKGMQSGKPELIMLDIMLPGEDGISILKKLRGSPVTEDIPVIMATARDSEFDKVTGLDLGADDYLAKPFGMMEMVARIKAVLRRTSKPGQDVLTCGDISLDEARHTVSVSGKPVQLTLKEYDLLRLFMHHPGQVYTREMLLGKVWGTDFVGESRTVDVHIGTLRTKLAAAGGQIRTVRGVGYKIEENGGSANER